MSAWAVAMLVLQTRPVADAKPVTAREARAAFVRATALLEKVNGRKLGVPAIPNLARVATRAEIVAEMARIVTASEGSFRFTPKAVSYDPAVFRVASPQVPLLKLLVVRGFVAPVGPLAVGPQPGLTPKQFGDALGFFLARTAQLSHLPSPKWSPILDP